MRTVLIIIASIISCAFASAQPELEFRDEIRAPDSWELVIEYHTPSKVITSKVMDLYRINSYSILKSEYADFCNCDWVDMVGNLELPVTAAYIPRGFNMSCRQGNILIAQLKKFHNAGKDTDLIVELKKLWGEYDLPSNEFNAMLYDTRIFMRLSENLEIPVDQETSSKHLVQDGETLYRISVKYGVSVEAIQSANNMGASTSINAGTFLTIPTTK